MYLHCFKHLNDESVLIVDAKILHLYLLGILSQSQFVSPKVVHLVTCQIVVQSDNGALA